MSKRFLSLVLASLFSFMIPLKVSAADELIKKIDIKIPGTDVVLTMENVLPEYVFFEEDIYDSDKTLPVYRFAFPGNTGKVSADRPSESRGSIYLEDGAMGATFPT
ncbi:MAG: hypothetical protein LBC41_01045, partial [Clostridiales bacterium]|nr:hypothetical protein [Clostridiales bacterium]